MTDDTRYPRAVRERLMMARADARELVAARTDDVRKLIERGCGWHHPHVRMARARLASALADIQTLKQLTRDTAIQPLVTRRGR